MDTDQIALLIVSRETHDRIKEIAQHRGFDEPDDYLRALVEADAEEHGESAIFDEVDVLSELKEGLRQALRGETVPLESLWETDG
jgi:hypothetical protein